ncbi:hypothetical protein [Gayadomonas joobiniege]|uniref:hypothetical protein n=1 Tax=Gayadomonas joobiniege TaxID=1234606 RepID=UPI000366270A|nr:hypothetical protein [Gayadomonas joobiniege]
MHLKELFNTDIPGQQSVPAWMKGAFRRRCISFANGLSDQTTRVFWLQSDGLTIDIRLPELHQQLADDESYAAKLDYEAWFAHSCWDQQALSWQNGEAFQLVNRWPESAILNRVGNCMIEFAPSGAYVEDWRLLSDQRGPLIGLELLTETNLETGESRPRSGALIINGQMAGLVIGRANPLHHCSASRLIDYYNNLEKHSDKTNLLAFETSIAVGNIDTGYTVSHSLDVDRLGMPLIELNGFYLADEDGFCIQQLQENGQTIERLFKIDCYYRDFNFSPLSKSTEQAEHWYKLNEGTLARYTEKLC